MVQDGSVVINGSLIASHMYPIILRHFWWPWWPSVAGSQVSRFWTETPYVCTYYLASGDQILHGDQSRWGKFYRVHHVPPSCESQKCLGHACAFWRTAVKFSMGKPSREETCFEGQLCPCNTRGAGVRPYCPQIFGTLLMLIPFDIQWPNLAR